MEKQNKLSVKYRQLTILHYTGLKKKICYTYNKKCI